MLRMTISKPKPISVQNIVGSHQSGQCCPKNKPKNPTNPIITIDVMIISPMRSNVVIICSFELQIFSYRCISFSTFRTLALVSDGFAEVPSHIRFYLWGYFEMLSAVASDFYFINFTYLFHIRCSYLLIQRYNKKMKPPNISGDFIKK